MTHSFTREELFELVWSKPMSNLAKELGVSDVGLAKACKRAGIPVPGLGYWTKVRHGKKVDRKPLPPVKTGAPGIVEITSGIRRPQPPELPPEIEEQVAREATSEWKVTVPKTLSNPHRIIHAWLEDNRRQRETARRIPYGPYNPTYSPRHYTKTERRRLRVLSALFKALEKRGHDVIADAQNIRNVALAIAGEKVDFTITQRQRQFKEELTAEENRNPHNIIRDAKWKAH